MDALSFDRFSKFQELIAEQVNVPASKQYLLYENIPLSEFVDPYEEVRNYPDTSSNVPFFLFDVDIATVNQLGQPSIRKSSSKQMLLPSLDPIGGLCSYRSPHLHDHTTISSQTTVIVNCAIENNIDSQRYIHYLTS